MPLRTLAKDWPGKDSKKMHTARDLVKAGVLERGRGYTADGKWCWMFWPAKKKK